MQNCTAIRVGDLKWVTGNVGDSRILRWYVSTAQREERREDRRTTQVVVVWSIGAAALVSLLRATMRVRKLVVYVFGTKR
jgi:hypothetical protein